MLILGQFSPSSQMISFVSKVSSEASLRKQNRIIFVESAKADGTVVYAYCQCPAGEVGTCSHAFAVMKLVAEWVIDKINKIPEPKVCTSKLCAWSIPQSGEKDWKSHQSLG